MRKGKGLVEMMSSVLNIMSLKMPVEFPSKNFQAKRM